VVVPGSILTLVNQLKPDRVILLPTRHPSGARVNERGAKLDTYENAVRTREELYKGEYCQRVTDVVIEPLLVANPTDYASVLESLRRSIKSFKNKLGDGQARLYVSAASGTPAIKTGMVLFVSSGELAPDRTEVYQVADPRYVTAGETRISTVDVSVIEAMRLIAHVSDLLKGEALDLARENLQRLALISASPERRSLIIALGHYLEALQLHQRLAYRAARQRLSVLMSEKENQARLNRIASLIGQQMQVLHELTGGDKTVLLHDLLLNAERRQRRGEYADALARCWRVVEETLREQLHRVHHVYEDGMVSVEQRVKLEQVFATRQTSPLEGNRLRGNLYVGLLVSILRALDDQVVAIALSQTLGPYLQRSINLCLQQQMDSGSDDLKADLRSSFKIYTGQMIAELAFPGGYKVITHDDLLRWINIVRNRSVVGHGYQDVGQVEGEAAVALARQVVSAIVGLPVPNHPFGLQEHRRMADWAREAIIAA